MGTKTLFLLTLLCPFFVNPCPLKAEKILNPARDSVKVIPGSPASDTLSVILDQPRAGEESDISRFTKVNFYPPEAAALMRYVDYPVSPLTGIPDIRIPLYTIQAGSVTIPVELSFHMDSYLRVNQLPGSAGAGWSLSSELQISRTVNGFDDFQTNESKIGYYYNTGWVETNFTGQEKKFFTQSDKRRMAQGLIDTEPDKFYYKLGGKSGAFYFQRQPDNSIKPVPVPYDGVKISYNPTGQIFTLIDTDGTTYVFSATNTDRVLLPGTSFYTTMGWKCNKITSVTGQTEVTFSYGNYTYNNISEMVGRQEIFDDHNERSGPYSLYRMMCNDKNVNPVTDADYPWWQIMGPSMKIFSSAPSEMRFFTNGSSGPEFLKMTNSGYSIGGGEPAQRISVMNNSYVSEISFRGGKLTFTYTDKHILTSIKVTNSGGTVIKTINLTQPATEVTSSSLNDKYIRTLNALNIGDEKYTFAYNISRKGGAMSNFWGYDGEYGGSSAYVILPRQDVDISMGNCERFFVGCQNVSTRTFKYWLGGENIFAISSNRTLLNITYPTGGRAEFIIGQNRYRSTSDNTVCGSGGYRIEEIRYYESGNANPVKGKIYKYGPGEDGTGIPRITPVAGGYGSNLYTQQNVSFFYGGELIHTARKRVFSAGTIQSKNFDNGAAVNYDQVAEYEYDRGEQSGKTVYTSDMHYYNSYNASPTDPYPLEEDEWYLGMPESTVYYKYKNGQYVWTKKTEKTYNKYFDPIQIYQGRCWTNTEALLVGGSLGTMSYETFVENNSSYYYKIRGVRTGIVQLNSITESEQDDNGNVLKNETRYYYDSPKDIHPSRLERSISDGTFETEHMVYPNSYLTSSGEGSFIASLVNNNIVDKPVEQVVRRNGKVVSGLLNFYNANGTLSSVYTLHDAKPADTGFKLSNRAQGNYDSDALKNTAFSRSSLYSQEAKVERYDSYGNPVYMTYTDKKISVCYIWSYNGLYPVAEISNATYADVVSALGAVPLENFSSQLSPDMSKINNLRTNALLKNAQITTCSYDQLKGMTSSTSPDGLTTYYSYDSSGRLWKVYMKENGVDKVIKEYTYHYK